MIRVLFVCLGNICRSPMAEAILRHKVKEAGLDGKIIVDSAGTGDWHIGEAPHQGTRNLLLNKNIDAAGLKARKITSADFQEFQYIVVMDDNNLTNVTKLDKDSTDIKMKKMLDYHPEKSGDNVPDPYYTGNFEEVYELLDISCSKLLDELKQLI